MRIEQKATLTVGLIVTLLCLAFLYQGISQHNQTIDQLMERTASQIDQNVTAAKNFSFDGYEKRIQTLLSVQNKAITAFIARDRKALYQSALPAFNQLRAENSYFEILHFHLPDGTTLLRMHDPDHYGDNLLDSRPMIRAMHQQQKMMTGCEIGVHGTYYRVIAPIFDGDTYVGAVEFGISMNLVADYLRRHLEIPSASLLDLGELPDASSFAGSKRLHRGDLLIDAPADSLFSHLPDLHNLGAVTHLRTISIDDHQYVFHIHKLFSDFNGKLFCGIIAVQDISDLINDKNNFLVRTLLFSAILLLLTFLTLHFTFGQMVRAMVQKNRELELAEAKYRSTASFLESLMDSIPDLIFSKDGKGIYRSCNQAFAAFYDMNREDIIGRSDHDLFPPEQADRFVESDERARELGQFRGRQQWQETSLGDRRAMDTIKIPLLDEKGTPQGIIGISRDITAQKLGEESLKNAARQWAITIDASDDIIFLVDLKHRLLRGNLAFSNMAGLTPKEAMGKDIRALIHPPGVNDKSCALCQALEALQDQVLTVEADECCNPLGKPVQATVKVLYNTEQKPISIFYSLHDLSYQRRIENQLRASSDEWERTFHAFPDLITIQDKEMRIIKANDAATHLLAQNDKDLVGQTCYQVFRGQDQPCPNCPGLTTFETGQTSSEIIEHQNLNKVFQVTISPILDRDGQILHLAHVAKDITAQKRLEQELLQAHKMEAIGTLAGGIAHDFNNILTAIIGFAEMAKLNTPPDSPVFDDLKQILKGGRRAADLVRQILTFSRKSDELRPAPISPHLIVKEALKMLGASLPKTLSIHQEIDQDCGLILANPTHIHQIVINLCTNALHAMENEQGTLTVTLGRREFSAEELNGKDECLPGPHIVLSVSDTGCGMAEETLDRIFDPYYTTKEKGRGTGLGLAVIHGIVKEYHGLIQVESTPGQGSTFTVSLPAMADPIFDQDLISTLTPENMATGTERILIIDDEEPILAMQESVLTYLGYQVTCFNDSQQAMQAISEHPDQFDLVITDQTMPKLSGIEIVRQVLTLRPDLPIIICTGYSSVLSERKALDSGARKFLLKPINVEVLAAAVREALDT